MPAFYFPPQNGGGGGGGGSEYWGDAVANFAALPVSGVVVGEVRLVLDTNILYEWDGTAWQPITAGGDVVGPASSTDNAVARYDGTTGKLIQDSGVIVDDTNNVSGIADIEITGTTTLDTSLSGPVRASSGVISTGDTDLATEVTGSLPIANGGTNSSTALANDRILVSNTGAIVEAAAITASRALESDASGIPVASSTTATELGYVSGVTSSIQTQLDAKAADTGTPDRLAVYDSAGDLTSINQLATNPTHKTIAFNNTINFIDNQGGQDHTITVNENATASAPATTRTALAINQNVDTDNDGFDFGTNGQSMRVLTLFVNHQGKSDIGGFGLLDNSFNIGNGTDAISVKGFAYSYGFGSINANVTVDGSIQGYGFQPNIQTGATLTTNAGVQAFYDNANVQVPMQAAYISMGLNPSIFEVANNTQMQGINLNPTVTGFNGSGGYAGVSLSGTFGTMNANSQYYGLNINPTIASARYAAGIQVSMDNVVPYAGTQSSLVFQDLTLTWILPNDNNSYTLEYTTGGTAGSEVVTISGNSITVQIDSGVSTATQVRTALLANTGFAANIGVVISGTGSNPQVTAGPTNFTGGTSPGQIYAGYFDGNVAITGSLEFNGNFQCAKFDAFRQYNLTDGGGQPSSGHSLVTSPTVAANVTIANADTLGVNTAALFNIGDNAVVTTAFLGLSALGLPAVLTMGAGSTVDRISGAVFALSLDGTAGGGTVNEVALCRSLAIPNGVTTVNRLYGYEFDVPFGSVGTDAWGVYLRTNINNWMQGSLKLGGSSGSTDKVTNTDVKLELEGGALLNASMDTTTRDALTAVNGMQIYNTTTTQMEAYQNGSWGAMGGGGGSGQFTTTVSSISANTSLVDKTLYYVDTTGGAVTLTLPAPTSGAYIVVKDSGAAADTNNITINPNGAELIDTLSAWVMDEELSSIVLTSDGTDWYII